MATLPGGSCWSFCCCAAVLGVITLKPEATSMPSLFWVLLGVAQPTVNANRAMTLITLNEVRIRFIFIGSIEFCVVLEMISSPEKNFPKNVGLFSDRCL